MSAAARALLAVGLLILPACDFSPFCLDCTSSPDLKGGGTGDGGISDLSEQPDLVESGDLSPVLDIGPCVPTNSGVEICDGIDNDCNGTIDDVAADKVKEDPRNCGACGNVCNFLATHQFGACVGGDAGTPHCEATTCVPGFQDIDPNAPGCEYACFPTGAEVCDGVDNDCNGTIDDGFGYPNYDTNLAHCGGCGQICARTGANTACQAGAGGKGECVVTSCINEPGVQTYKHNGDAASRNLVGCEYKCKTPSSTAGDCSDPSGGCTFPEETCDGEDNDCNFDIDDNVTDVGDDCSTHCPGGVCKGECTTGKTICSGGVPVCDGGIGPVDEVCDGKDNNCDGNADETFRNPDAVTADPMLTQDPPIGGYNIDADNCGGCFNPADSNTNVNKCSTQLSNGTVGCKPASGTTSTGTCYVVACDAGYAALPANTTCAVGPQPTLVGTGCNYKCPVYPARPESCNAMDDDCDGCVDEPTDLFFPDTLCSTEGACGDGDGKSKVIPECTGGKLVCNYKQQSALKNLGLDVDPDNDYKLAALETKCDNIDNNCNGTIDTDGFLEITTPATECTEPGKVGLCQRQGQFECANDKLSVTCVLPGNPIDPQPELCDGIDNDCDGDIDEGANAKGSNPLYVVDDFVQINGSLWIYRYEASKPDATADSSGTSKARSCSKKGALPWVSVTWDEAKAACESRGFRLCTSTEWETACTAGNANRKYPYGDTSTGNGDDYNADYCNGKDYKLVCGGSDSFEQVMPTGTPYGCDASQTTSRCVSPDGVVDLSGNVKEWTSTQPSMSVLSYEVRGGAFDNIASGLTCQFNFLSLPPATSLGTVGFRCCSSVAP